MAAETFRMMLISVCVFVLLPQAASSHGKIPLPVEPAHYIGCMIPDHLVSLSLTDDNIATELTLRLASFRYSQRDFEAMSARKCVFICWYQKHTYAGVQNGTSCFCGDTLKGMTKLLEKDCKLHCKSACSDQCGGRVALSVFKTSYRDLPATFIDASLFRSEGYIGCFKPGQYGMCWTEADVQMYSFDPHLASLAYLPVVFSSRMTAQACAVYCLTSKMKYSVLKSPSHCCCEWLERRLDQQKKDPDPCTMNCDGDKTTPCYGSVKGVYYYAVFNNLALMEKTDIPLMTIQEFNASGILYPYFPGIYGFPSRRRSADVIEYLKGLASPAKTEAGSLPGKSTHQIVDPTNTGVGVVDVPEKASDSKKPVQIVLGIVAALLLGFFVVTFSMKRVKDTKPTTK